ncbi:MAG TPA: hypothetical protein DCY13_22580, partial [Verrucomicrobiales bacterium]|nr:hypothetical protein [Verrucomicrobiales bacterium]
GLSVVVDPLGRVTSWVRDLQGRVTSKVFADGSQVHREYDPATAWLKGIRDERNQITRLDYNLDGSLRQRRYFDAHIPIATMKLTYDPNYRRLLTREDGSGVTTYGYHPITANPGFGAGKLASVDGPLPNDTITYAYDGLGRVVSRAINGVGILRTWDEAGRLSRLTN